MVFPLSQAVICQKQLYIYGNNTARGKNEGGKAISSELEIAQAILRSRCHRGLSQLICETVGDDAHIVPFSLRSYGRKSGAIFPKKRPEKAGNDYGKIHFFKFLEVFALRRRGKRLLFMKKRGRFRAPVVSSYEVFTWRRVRLYRGTYRKP